MEVDRSRPRKIGVGCPTLVPTEVDHDRVFGNLLHNVADGVRVLTRTMQRASTALGDPAGRIRNRLRSVTRRVLIIGYEARSPKTRDAMVKSYRTLMATTRAVLRDAATIVRRLRHRARTASPPIRPILQRAQDRLAAMRPLVQRVVDQTRARVLGGDTHVPGKVLSLFELAR